MKQLINSCSAGALESRLFTGEQRDSESSFYYLRARYYDPAIGRFLTQDPIPSGHPYVYVWNNPARYKDPFGLFGLGDLNPIDDIVDCAKDPKDCGGDVAETVGGGLKKGAEKTGEFFTETVPKAAQDAAQWVAEDYHWAVVGATAAGTVFLVGTVAGAPVAVLVVAGGVDVGFSTFAAVQSGRHCFSGNTGWVQSCIRTAVGSFSVVPGFIPGKVGVFFTYVPLLTELGLSVTDAAFAGGQANDKE